MSLDDAVKHMAEHRATAGALYAVEEVGRLASAISQIYTVRNRTTGLSEEVIANRIALCEVMLRLLKSELKKAIAERLIPALQEWEKYDG